MLTNAGPDMRESFHQAIRENPHDSATRHIYSDWLEENNHSDEALHHRIIALGIDRGSEAARRFSAAEFGHADIGSRNILPFSVQGPEYYYPGRSKVTNPLYVYRGKRGWTGEGRAPLVRRFSTPLEASKAATRAGAGLMTQSNMPSIKRARSAENEAEFIARNKPKNRHEQEILDTPIMALIPRPKGEGSIMAAKAHETAASHHLQAADDLETKGTGRLRYGLASLHRRAALAHLYASFVHRAALGEV